MATQLDDPEDRRVRRPHRRDAGQHGPAAPQHPRRAAGGAADRRRNRLRSRAAHRLPAPLRRKDRRERSRPAVGSVHRPAGLPGRDEHEPRLVAVRREAAGLRGAGEGPAHAGDHRRVEPHRQPPGGHGGLRAGPGQFHARSCAPSANGRRSSTCSRRFAAPG